MAAGAGVAVGSAGLDVGSTIVVIVVFVVVAACTVVVPIVAYLIASERLRGPLDKLRGWLERGERGDHGDPSARHRIVMIGKGIGSF